VIQDFDGPAPGTWRAVLQLDPDFVTNNKKGEPLPEKLNIKFDDINVTQLPFNFDVIYKEDKSIHIKIRNGQEEILLDEIVIGRDRKTAKDTILINFPIYDSSIKAIYQGNIMQGDWIVHSKDDYRIPFKAYYGKAHRFTVNKKTPTTDITGNWKVDFTDTSGSFAGIGVFEQKGNHLTGTFKTETGDYRFLEGTIQDKKIYLSCFDGSHAFLFEGKIADDNASISGAFKSGKHYTAYWKAVKDDTYALNDPYSMTYLKEGYDEVMFSFKDTNGQMVSLSDERYNSRPKVIQIFGTWCPNCRDETNFLLDYLNDNPDPGFDIIALGFEKYKDEGKAIKALKTYKDKLDVPYPMLLGGYYNKKEAAKALPMLNAIISYPTMIFLDKNNKVYKIHTGFNGPATNEYEEFKKEFASNIAYLLTE
jgi:thiol-disulfide isomerase/thioredoxin